MSLFQGGFAKNITLKEILNYDEAFIHHFFVVMCMQGVTWHVDHIAKTLIDTSHFSTNFPLWTSQLVLRKNSRSCECEKSRLFWVMCLPGGNSEHFPGFYKIRICVNVFFVGGKLEKTRKAQNHLILWELFF